MPKGVSTEGKATFPFTAPYGTPPTSRPQTQNQTKCLSGLCTAVAPVPTMLQKTGAKGPGTYTQSVIPTGGIGVYVQPAGSAVSDSSLVQPHNDLPAYRSAKGVY